MYTNHVRCRACGFGPALVPEGIKSEDNGQKLIPVFDLGLQPLANDFRSDSEEQAGFAPLKVLFCPRCSLAQLSVVVRSDILYSNYAYLTSGSGAMIQHFDRLFDDLGVSQMASVVEIGSNDGKLLEYFRERKPGLKVVGIDPARNLSQLAFGRNIGTVVSVFDKEAARAANAINPDLVLARHVFCHVDDWEEFIASLSLMGHNKTKYVIEVPYVKELLDKVEFDTIYHEHLSYLSIKAVMALLEKSPLILESVREYPIHGGAILLTLRRRGAAQGDESVGRYLAAEDFTQERWSQFSLEAGNRILDLKKTVDGLVASGKAVCGFGASAKSTVVVNACKFTRKQIRFICDNTPQKQWKLSPGSDIPIVDESALIREQPDYCLLFAWNWKEVVLSQCDRYIKAGGKFIVPGKTLEILPA